MGAEPPSARAPRRGGAATQLIGASLLAAGALGTTPSTPLGAQPAPPHPVHAPPRDTLPAPRGAATHSAAAHDDRFRVSVQAVPMATRLDPAIGGRAIAEGYLSQPAVMAHGGVPGTPLRLVATVNLEGLTLRRGELWGGVYGEGYVDRRHPHTYLHELMASVDGALPVLGGWRASLSAGKGFAPFGTDDPMMRPFARYPVNHHLAQVLERAVLIAAVRAPRALVEAGVFNGDEPVNPESWPRLSRVGDSWAVRASVLPLGPVRGDAWTAEGVELQGSVAHVRSPEHPAGGLLDQRKVSLSLRAARGAPLGAAGLGTRAPGDYLLVEWARTDAHRDGRRVDLAGFRQQSVLAEGGIRRRGVELVARLERTGRAEEERLLDPFRSQRPESDYSILGVTEWRVATLGAAVPLMIGRGRGALRLAPFVEVSRLAPREIVRPTVFVAEAFYGARVLHSATVGVRMGLGTPHRRMGRYGVAAALDHAAPPSAQLTSPPSPSVP